MGRAEHRGVGQQFGGAGGDAHPALAQHVVVGDSDVDDRVEGCHVGGGGRVAGGDHDVEPVERREFVGDAPTQVATHATHVHPAARLAERRSRHVGDATPPRGKPFTVP